MFKEYINKQFTSYQNAVEYYTINPDCIINIEKFVMNEIRHFIDLHLPEIKRDYDEASYLYPFWKNYPPLDRGRAPIGDQYPWIEVGEQVFGNPVISRQILESKTLDCLLVLMIDVLYLVNE